MPPDNASYMHAAYAAAVVVYALYVVTLWRRRARVKKELQAVGDRG
jgi:heme A synthase